ncbi:hypothetical protein MSIMFI_02941 [Mycobacterium simulans]|nr:hypothetical protein MSIMFI_02941 [Mycobacterium simulans]
MAAATSEASSNPPNAVRSEMPSAQPGSANDTGIPNGKRHLATKPTLAAGLVARAAAAKVPRSWVAGDGVYVATAG